MSSLQFEVVGLAHFTNGRACEKHKTCGSQVKVGSIVRLLETTIKIGQLTEPAVEAVLECNDSACRVGFLPRFLLKEKERYVGTTS